ncbi:GD11097 [Drosophila simulans]|uniref:GD11097 n=1 Tax=Drosophila simulans TaxID=7240 RepID=B4QGD3_DROSI|nr:GD11097 [Drosophila simulans]
MGRRRCRGVRGQKDAAVDGDDNGDVKVFRGSPSTCLRRAQYALPKLQAGGMEMLQGGIEALKELHKMLDVAKKNEKNKKKKVVARSDGDSLT